MTLADIYTKDELKSNEWYFAYVEIGVKRHRKSNCPTPNFNQVEKLPIKLDDWACYDIASAYVKKVFELHPEYNIDDFYAHVVNGDSCSSCLQNISIYHLFN